MVLQTTQCRSINVVSLLCASHELARLPPVGQLPRFGREAPWVWVVGVLSHGWSINTEPPTHQSIDPTRVALHDSCRAACWRGSAHACVCATPMQRAGCAAIDNRTSAAHRGILPAHTGSDALPISRPVPRNLGTLESRHDERAHGAVRIPEPGRSLRRCAHRAGIRPRMAAECRPCAATVPRLAVRGDRMPVRFAAAGRLCIAVPREAEAV